MINKIFKRHFHPGFNINGKITLPKCIDNISCEYFKPVWGNKVQEIQLQKDNYTYNTSCINKYTNLILNKLEYTITVPTSHNTPIETALLSCRNLDSQRYINMIGKLNVVDSNGVFINNGINREKLLNIVNKGNNKQEKEILESVIYGIFSNYGDSIYIANDYLYVGKSDYNYVVISNYPNKVSQREIERSRIIAYCLKNGNMPLLLENDVDFEGEANIKFIPALIKNKNQNYQMCISYDSTRSNSKCIYNINKLLKKVNLPLLKEIKIRPNSEMEEYFYHQDCLLNFRTDTKLQIFNNEYEFFKNYKPNGLLVVAENAVNNIYRKKLEFLFEDIIYVNIKDDLLAANMILSNQGAVFSSNLSNKNEIENKIKNSINFSHPSHGGGGAHKCCSNVLVLDKEIKFEEWLNFCKTKKISLNINLMKGVENELKRLYS